MTDLEQRLSDLGDHLVFDHSDLAGEVLTRLDGGAATIDRRRPSAPLVLRAAAAVVVVVALAAAVVPSTRHAVADWLGLDRVRIVREDGAGTSVSPTSIARTATAPPATTAASPALDERIVVVDRRQITVGTLDARLTDAMITKTVSGDASVRLVTIDGLAGVWVPEPHEIAVEIDGAPTILRLAGPTLLWQDGDVLWRVEGFDQLEPALTYARSLHASGG